MTTTTTADLTTFAKATSSLAPARQGARRRKVGTTAIVQVQAACDIIRANPEKRHTLSVLAGRVGLSPFHFQRTFTQLVGISPRAFAEACRLGQLKTALKKGARVTPALYDAGYGSSSRLYERSNTALGMTPATYRRGGLGAEIDFTIVESPLGRLLLASTVRGVCRVMIGDTEGALENELRQEFPHAVIRRNGRILSSQVRGLLSYLRGRSPHPELALDVRATAFQWRVWRQLRAIPYGETRSYREVAESIGKPSATRAVARACATNPVALLIPCHRVIRTDGSMGGYRWGIKRKEQLLEQERKAKG
jgi:AraC family transcriptional regulator, regulatory protein of adaptative response / methylated-DNA-[protein]-cysteine methyltransferase